MKISKKVPFVVYTIISVVLLLALLFGIGYITNFSRDSFWRDSNHDSVIIEGNNGQDGLNQAGTNITKYKIDCGYGKVTIKSTNDKPYIQYSDEAAFSTKTYISGNEMQIQLDSRESFGYDFFNNLFHNRTREAIIYLPQENLESLVVIASANAITIQDINVKKMEVRLSAGDVRVKDCKVEEMKSELNAGNFEFYANKGIQKIDSEVNAGNMDLFLPKDIDGFKCRYDVNLGNIDNDTSFDVTGDKENHFVNRNGTFSFGDESCDITLDVSVGNISIDDYHAS